MSTEHRLSVLIVDDEPGLRLGLRANFIRHGWQTEVAPGVREANRLLQSRHFDLVLCDVRMGDGDGFEVLQLLRNREPRAALLFLTAFASVPEAVRAMRGGAVDYLTKPVAFEQILEVALRTLEQRPLAPARPSGAASMIGQSRALLDALARAEAAAKTDADVLIEAESGTGKELLARYLHDQSRRARQPFLAVNCAALPEALLESELFGYARGAFTGASAAKAGKFELANGGTLLLDEIGEMPLSLQPKLLRVLQERVVDRLGDGRPLPVDLRIIAATNQRLDAVVDRGLFRSDLFFRLNVIPLSLPPLRERMTDVAVLAEHFAAVFSQRTGQAAPALHPSFLARLGAYDWPGNVRELQHFMQRVVSLYSGAELTAEQFDREHRPVRRIDAPHTGRTSFSSAVQAASMDAVERTHLEQTLEQAGGNRTRAAEMLGISVRTMRNKIRQYDLPPRRYA